MIESVRKNFLAYLSVFVSVLFGLSGIYYYYRDKKPEITIEILNDSNVLDVHEPLKDLSVFFHGQNIEKNNLNLKIMHVRIENTGETSILQNDYASNLDWGLKIGDGKIIEARLLEDECNSNYIKDNLNPELVGSDFVKFQKVIFEKRKYFTFNLLILHNKNNKVELSLVGKIAGIEKFLTTTPNKQPESGSPLSVFLAAFGGNVLIQLARVIVYFIAATILFVLIVMVMIMFSERKEKRLKAKRLKLTEKSFVPYEKATFKIFIDAYIENGIDILFYINKKFSDSAKMYEDFGVFLVDVPLHKYVKVLSYTLHGGRPDVDQYKEYYFSFGSLLTELKKENAARIEDGKIEIAKTQKDFLTKMIETLRKEDGVLNKL